MRLTVTPLGASRQSVSGVARAVVDYLAGEPTKRGVPLLDSTTGAVGSDYADSIEGPGRRRGAGAAFRSLDGVVTREAFQRVLEGRHPTTGEWDRAAASILATVEELVRRNVAEYLGRSLGAQLVDDRPDWFSRHIRDAARAGRIGQSDPERVALLILERDATGKGRPRNPSGGRSIGPGA